MEMKKFILLFFLILYAFTFSDSWENSTDLIIPTASTAYGIIDNELYLVGAETGNTSYSILQKYDLLTNAWERKADLPIYTTAPGGCAYNNKLYVFGGYDGSSELNEVLVYDSLADTWTIMPSTLPTSRYNMIAEEINGIIYVIGGYNFSTNTKYAVNEAYDPATDSWTTKAPMPEATRGMGSAVYNNKIYVFGGLSSTTTNKMYVYDPATDSWTQKASMPTARRYLAGTQLYGKIYAIGGYISNYTDKNEVYDPNTDTWETKTPINLARAWQCVTTITGNIYVAGGSVASLPTKSMEKYTPDFDEMGIDQGLFKSKLFTLKKIDTNFNLNNMKSIYFKKQISLNSLKNNLNKIKNSIDKKSREIDNIKDNLSLNKKSHIYNKTEIKKFKKKIKNLKKQIKIANKEINPIEKNIKALQNNIISIESVINSHLHNVVEGIKGVLNIPCTIENQLPFSEYITMAKIKGQLEKKNENMAIEKAKNIIINDYFLKKIHRSDIEILEIIHIGEGNFNIHYIGNNDIESISFKQEYNIKCKVLKNPF